MQKTGTGAYHQAPRRKVRRWPGIVSLVVSVAAALACGLIVYRAVDGLYPVTDFDWRTYAGLLVLCLLVAAICLVFAIIGLIRQGSRLLALLSMVVLFGGTPWAVSHAVASGVDHLIRELAIVAGNNKDQIVDQVVAALNARGVSVPGWVNSLMSWFT